MSQDGKSRSRNDVQRIDTGGNGQDQDRSSVFTKNHFIDNKPIATKSATLSFQQSMELYRVNAIKSNDAKIQMDFAYYLLESARKIGDAINYESDEQRHPLPVPGISEMSGTTPNSARSPAFKQAIRKSKTAPNLNTLVNDYDSEQGANTPNSTNSGALRASIFSPAAPNAPVVPADPDLQNSMQQEAIKIIKKLANSSTTVAKQQNVEAQFFLAEAYGKGLYGLEVDYEKSFGLYLLASKMNHNEATYRVAVCYELGAGTRKDNNRALSYYRKAAALGNPLAMHKIGLILLQGLLGQNKNEREAITWLKRAAHLATKEHPHALHDLAQCHEPDIGSSVVIADEGYSLELYSKAAELSFAPSQYRLGMAFEYGQMGLAIDPKASIHWYQKAADQGFPEAELALSGWFLTGAEGILPQSDTEAYLWARRAAEQNLAKAQYAVGYYSEQGIGVRPDIEEAKRWFYRAAKQGHQKSIQKLEDIKKAGLGGPAGYNESKGRKEDCIVM